MRLVHHQDQMRTQNQERLVNHAKTTPAVSQPQENADIVITGPEILIRAQAPVSAQLVHAKKTTLIALQPQENADTVITGLEIPIHAQVHANAQKDPVVTSMLIASHLSETLQPH